jgi:DNA topoisomerase-3
VKQWTGRKCSAPGCNFELCLYSVGTPPRTFPLCPYCFNNPKKEWGKIPGEDPENSEVTDNAVDRDDEAKERQIRRIGGTSLILECPHPDGHPLIREMTVSPDPDSTNDEGVFILDPHFGPKWRLVSTRAPTILHFPKSVENVTLLEKVDDVLTTCHLMQVEFKGNESPLTNGETKHVCCFPIDTQMQSLVRVFHGSERLKASGHGGRGRGRGGRGGRSRKGPGGGDR